MKGEGPQWTITSIPLSEVEAYRAAAEDGGYIVGFFGRPATEDDPHIIRGE